MRVTLLQISLDPNSHAANMQALSRAVDRAVNVDPAPDLIVLPGACDTGGSLTGRTWTSARLEGARENIALKAREWGVFVAAGLCRRRNGSLESYAVLFDPDGDVASRSLPGSGEPSEGTLEFARPWPTVVGRIGVVEPTLSAPLVQHVQSPSRDVLMAVPVAAVLSGRRARVVAQNVSALREGVDGCAGVYWAVVGAAGKRHSSTDGSVVSTFLRAPDGSILASAHGEREAILEVEVPLVVVE